MTNITISSVALAGWQSGSAVELRIFLDRTIKAPDGTIVESGSFNTGFWRTFTCSVSGTTITIASGTLVATRDSDLPNSRYSAYFFNPNTSALIQIFDGFDGFGIPAIPTSTTWSDILTFNRANVPLPIDNTTYSKDEILALINNVASTMTGIVSLSTGGTGANLSASAAGFIKKATSGSTALATATITAADLPLIENLNTSTGLTVPQGGTGRLTNTLNGVLYGNGSSALLATAQGPANSVLTANAGAPSFSATPTLTSLTTTGSATIGTTLGVTGQLNANGGLAVTGAASISTNLTISGLTAASIPFAGTAGLISQNNSRFYWDNSAFELNIKGVDRLRGATAGTVGLQSPATTTSSLDYTYTLPPDYGTSGYVLTTMGNGTLTWAVNAGTPGMGITTLNGLTAATQVFATGTSGSDFNISSVTSTHTFNIPDAGAGARGLITTGTQTIAGAKTFSGALVASSTSTLTGAATTGSTLGLGGTLTTVAGTTTVAPIIFPSTSVKLTTPVAGVLESDQTSLYFTQTSGPTRKTIAYLDSNITGNAATATTATTATSATSFTGSLSGDISGTQGATVYNGIVPVAKGGLNLSSVATGETLYGSASNVYSKLAGNATATKNFLSMTSSIPAWGTIVANDVPNLESLNTSGGLPIAKGGTGATTASVARTNLGVAASGSNSDITALSGLTTALSIAQGGTNGTTKAVAFDNLAPTSVGGDTVVYNGTNNIRLANGTAGQIYTADPSGSAPFVKWSSDISVNNATIAQVLNSQAAVNWFVRSITANRTLDGTDRVISGNTTGGSFTVTLPTAVGISGREYTVTKTDSSANTIVIATTGGQTIDGAATITLITQKDTTNLISNGANWISTVQRFRPAFAEIGNLQPTGTSSPTGVMMGLALLITPTVSNRLNVSVCGVILNNTANAGGNYQLYYGTGTAPANGAAITGTSLGTLKHFITASGTAQSPFSINFTATGLSIGTTYWVDLSLGISSGGTATVKDVDILAFEF